mgnify:CR=1 FL=1
MAVDLRAAQERVDQLFSQRQKLEIYWDTAYRFMLPEHAQFFSSSKHDTPGELAEEVFDSTASDSAERLANLILSRLTPPWGRWFRLAPGMLATTDEQKEQMRAPADMVVERMHRALLRSNFYQEFQPMLLDRIIGGTGALAVERKPELKFRCVPLTGVAIEEDGNGVVGTVAQRLTMSLAQVKRAFPEADFSELERQVKDPHKADVELYIMSEREVDGAYLTITFDKKTKTLLRKDITQLPTTLVSRWSKLPGSAYGRGPGQRALADVRALNKLKELSLKQALLATASPFTVVDDGVINPLTVNIEPGALIPVASNDLNNPSIRLLEGATKFDVSMFSMDRLRGEIKAVFMQDQFSALERTPRSATEVAERSRIIAQDLGASIARLQEEVLVPVLRIVYQALADVGELPDGFDIDGGALKVEFTSFLAQSQWQADEQAILEMLSFSAQFGEIDPEAGMVINYAVAMRKLATLKGIPGEMLRSNQEVQQLLQQGAEGQAALQQAGGENVAGSGPAPQGQ